MKTSNLFSLGTQDFLKGLLVDAITPVITIIENSLSAVTITFNWKNIGLTALAAGIAYLSKNFFTPAQVVTPADVNTPAK